MASELRVDSIVPATGSSVSIGTATGGVNIPGVLTYEDVTNVDSIGVITARSSINVNAASSGIGVTINSGGINVTGVITATTFSGIDSDKISEGNTEVETVDTGSDGHIKFTTEGSERLRIDAIGHVTKPSQAMFSASGTGSSWNYFSSGSGWYSLGDAAIGGTSHNLNHSWTTTGRVGVGVRGVTSSGASIWENAKARFTAPVTGFYFFEINLYVRTFGGGKSMHVQPWVDTSDSQYYTSNIGVIRNSSNSDTGNTQQYPNSVMRSIVLQLTANQTFQWAVYAEGTNNFQTYKGYAHQSGYLIG